MYSSLSKNRLSDINLVRYKYPDSDNLLEVVKLLNTDSLELRSPNFSKYLWYYDRLSIREKSILNKFKYKNYFSRSINISGLFTRVSNELESPDILSKIIKKVGVNQLTVLHHTELSILEELLKLNLDDISVYDLLTTTPESIVKIPPRLYNSLAASLGLFKY